MTSRGLEPPTVHRLEVRHPCSVGPRGGQVTYAPVVAGAVLAEPRRPRFRGTADAGERTSWLPGCSRTSVRPCQGRRRASPGLQPLLGGVPLRRLTAEARPCWPPWRRTTAGTPAVERSYTRKLRAAVRDGWPVAAATSRRHRGAGTGRRPAGRAAHHHPRRAALAMEHARYADVGGCCGTPGGPCPRCSPTPRPTPPPRAGPLIGLGWSGCSSVSPRWWPRASRGCGAAPAWWAAFARWCRAASSGR